MPEIQLSETKLDESSAHSIAVQLSIAIWLAYIFEKQNLLFGSSAVQDLWTKQQRTMSSLGQQNVWTRLINLFESIHNGDGDVVKLNGGWFDFSKIKQVHLSDELATTIVQILLNTDVLCLTPRILGEIYEQSMVLEQQSKLNKKSTGTFFTPDWLIDRLNN